MFLRNRLLQLLLSGLSCVVVMGASDGAVCTNATMHGSYGMLGTGTAGGAVFAAVGRFTYDGKGNLTGKLWINAAGSNFGPVEFTGTYSVSPDCTMTDTWESGATHISIIIDEGKGYYILNNTQGGGETVSGQARRQ